VLFERGGISLYPVAGREERLAGDSAKPAIILTDLRLPEYQWGGSL